MTAAFEKYATIQLADDHEIEIATRMTDGRNIRPREGDAILLCGDREVEELVLTLDQVTDEYAEGVSVEGRARVYYRTDLMGPGPYYVDHITGEMPELFYPLMFVLSDRKA